MGFGRTPPYDANRYPKRGLEDGIKTVTAAGTDEALSSTSVKVKRITIQALTDNTGLIAVGTSGVDATEATGTGEALYAGDKREMLPDEGEILDLADVYIDATVTGDGVRYTYEY